METLEALHREKEQSFKETEAKMEGLWNAREEQWQTFQTQRTTEWQREANRYRDILRTHVAGIKLDPPDLAEGHSTE